MNKQQRHALIADLITAQEIETQEELVSALGAKGCDATQATVSRDIKELALVKIGGVNKKYRYVKAAGASSAMHSKFNNIFKECVLSIQSAKNIVVVKTVSGGANSAAAFIDNLDMDEVVGNIAGDDTIITVTKSDEAAQNVISILKNYF